MTPRGMLITLYNFCSQAGCMDGEHPAAGLVQASCGEFYGTTFQGGTNGYGTTFKVTPSGTLTTLYSFCSQTGCPEDSAHNGALVQATNGQFYGTTQYGGANGQGSIFEFAPNGALTTLHSFCAQMNCTDGGIPKAGLIQAANGDLYGTTSEGGRYGHGSVFKIALSGALTTEYSFCSKTGCADGGSPQAGLIQATDGDLYGTTGGIIFKITPGGTFTTLYTFCAQAAPDGGAPHCTDGSGPDTALVQGTDGDFYGTSNTGGSNPYPGNGTIFKITPNGTLTTLYNFCSESGCMDGEYPFAGLIQATNGHFYGVTSSGGIYGHGPVFSLSMGFGPSVQTRLTAGVRGTAREIREPI
jgi:uncharacterized repeat protein (TIGR03803 family)